MRMQFLHKTAAGDMHSTGHEPYALHIIRYLHIAVYNLYRIITYAETLKINIIFYLNNTKSIIHVIIRASNLDLA